MGSCKLDLGCVLAQDPNISLKYDDLEWSRSFPLFISGIVTVPEVEHTAESSSFGMLLHLCNLVL